MSKNSESHAPGPGAFEDAADAYMKFWSDFASKMTAAAFAASPGNAPPGAAREVRAATLKAMSESCDQYMRSPQFQEALKQWFANSILFRSRLNDWVGRMRHELQGVSRQDVDALMQAVGRLESRVSDGLERLSERLDALEASGGAAARLARGASSRPAHRARSRKSKP